MERILISGVTGQKPQAGAGQLLTFEEYQQRAADCLRVAQETEDPTSKALLLEMAQAWINLAERKRRAPGGWSDEGSKI